MFKIPKIEKFSQPKNADFSLHMLIHWSIIFRKDGTFEKLL